MKIARFRPGLLNYGYGARRARRPLPSRPCATITGGVGVSHERLVRAGYQPARQVDAACVSAEGKDDGE